MPENIEPITKVRLGFCMAVIAFSITVILSQSAGFCELNPILGLLFETYNTYQVILLYTILWGVIFTLYNYAEDNINKYQVNYLSNIILLVGFFDLLHDILSVVMYLS